MTAKNHCKQNNDDDKQRVLVKILLESFDKKSEQNEK
jgi:hypothetical protein